MFVAMFPCRSLLFENCTGAKVVVIIKIQNYIGRQKQL